MDPGLHIDRITDDESLTSDLGEDDATTLVKTLVAMATTGVLAVRTEDEADAVVDKLRKSGRGIGKTVAAWRDEGARAAAGVAAKAGLPSPPADIDSTAALLSFYLDRLGN